MLTSYPLGSGGTVFICPAVEAGMKKIHLAKSGLVLCASTACYTLRSARELSLENIMTFHDPTSYVDLSQGRMKHIDFHIQVDFCSRTLDVEAAYQMQEAISGSLYLDSFI